jgi:transposase
MWEILEVLRRVGRGEGQRAVARVTGHSRSTIRRWVACATELGWAAAIVEPDEALLAPHREQIRTWLAAEGSERGLQLSKVHELLTRKGVQVPYSSLHRFAVAHCGFHNARRVTVRRAEVAPGELAEVDFGRLGFVHDPATGKRRTLHALIVTLVHSRHQYVHVCHTQRLADFLEGLEDAFAFFGGVPARVVLDNLKAAVTKAERYDPVFQRTFAEYAEYRGFVIDAAVSRHPTGKPVVERQVQYVRESFLRGEAWIDRDHVQRDVVRWCLDGFEREDDAEPVQGELIPFPSRYLRDAEHFTHTKEEEKTHGSQSIAQDAPEASETLRDAPDAPGPRRLREEDEAP